MQPVLWWIALGVGAGTMGGLLGVGGGLVMIPVMVSAFGLTQHQPHGTSLAVMLPPVGALAVWRYYAAGHVRLDMAAWICVGFIVGGLLGAQLANSLSALWLRRVFGVFLLAVSVHLMLGR